MACDSYVEDVLCDYMHVPVTIRMYVQEVCELCGQRGRVGEDFRASGSAHVHWCNVMEISGTRRYLSEV